MFFFFTQQHSPLNSNSRFFSARNHICLSSYFYETNGCIGLSDLHLPTASPRIEKKERVFYISSLTLQYKTAERWRCTLPDKRKENERAEIRTTFLLTALTICIHTNKMTEKTNSEPFIIALYLYVALSLSFAYNQERKREKEKKKKITYRQTKRTWMYARI